MNNKKKLYLFLLLLPIIDVLTSITEKLNLNIPSLGIIIKSIFLGIMILYLIISSTSKYKKMSLYYLMAIFLYMVLFFITKIIYSVEYYKYRLDLIQKIQKEYFS